MTSAATIAAEPEPTSPAEAVDAVRARLAPLGVEDVALAQATGRVLAEAVRTDRDSPAIDVSSMDGFAVRTGDLGAMSSPQGLPIAEGPGAEAAIGQAPVAMRAGHAVRIVTGAPVPTGADAVVRHEDADAAAGRVRLRIPATDVRRGAFIRHRGENAPAGTEVLPPGTLLGAAAIGALATFGAATVRVHRRVRVAIVVTGDEIVGAAAVPAPWQVRDSNGAVLASLLAARPWIEVVAQRHAPDDADALARTLEAAAGESDAVILTGGVSMGHRDHVPEVARRMGAVTVFHRLPQRPGRPMLAAVLPARGERAAVPILGLPGNPVSVMVTARRLAVPMLGRLAGMHDAEFAAPARHVDGDDGATLGMWWFRLASEHVTADGERRLRLLPTKSSGDVATAAGSVGFVEVAPGCGSAGPNPFHHWMH